MVHVVGMRNVRLRGVGLVASVALSLVGANGCARTPAPTFPVGLGEPPPPGACPLRPACNGQLPDGTRSAFRHLRSRAASAIGPANHRGRDQIVKEGDHAVAQAKFAYGPSDKDLEGEDVEIYLQTGCAGSFARVATEIAGGEQTQPPKPGMIDGGGRVFFDLGVLPVGRHRVAFVVKGDGSRTDARIDVLPASARVVVTDVDGTQTTEEYEEVWSVLAGTMPNAQPGGARLLNALAYKGYVPFYLTARPEFLTGRTREFLALKGYPPGPVHTTTTLSGALRAAAAAFKTAELGALRGGGFSPSFLLGNRPSDAAAFTAERQTNEACWLLRVTDALHGCRRVESWEDVVKEVDDLPQSCP